MNDSTRDGDGEQPDASAPAPPRSAVPTGGAGFVWLPKAPADDGGDAAARPAPDETGPDDVVSDIHGPDDAEPDEHGPDEATRHVSASSEPGPSEPGPNEPEPSEIPPDETANDRPAPGEPSAPGAPDGPDPERQPAPHPEPDPAPDWVPPSREPDPYPAAPDEPSPLDPQPLSPSPLEVPLDPPSSDPPIPPTRSIPTMAEVLDAPSPRRAAREAAALQAAALESTARESSRQPDPDSLEQPRAVSSDQPVQAASDDAVPESGKPVPESREEPVFADEPPSPKLADAASGVDSLVGDTGTDSTASGRVTGGPLMDVPAAEWAASLRSASGRAESAEPDPASVAEPQERARPPMTVAQKRLFWVLGAVIVVAIVLLVVLLTTQRAGARTESAGQSMSTSYGSVSTSSMTPLSTSSGRNG